MYLILYIYRLKYQCEAPISFKQSLMIFTHSNIYKFAKPILKVHYFSPAFDDSVVVIGQRGAGEDYLLHFDKNSNLVYQALFGDFVDSLCMPTDRHAVVLRPEEGWILVFDLFVKEKYQYKHYFMTDVSCQCEVDYFCDSKLLCIHENGDHDDMRMMLTYYSWPLVFTESSSLSPPQIYAQFIADKEAWDPSYFVRKVNAHSKYVWNQTSHEEKFEVRMHELINGKSHYCSVTVKMDSLFAPYGLSEMKAAVIELWEFQPNVLLMFCATSKNEKNAVTNETKVVNNNFLWDTTLNIIREARFTFPPRRQDLLVDIYGTPSLSMFRTFDFKTKKAIPAPAYFISNSKEEIVQEEQWICSHLQKYKVFERNRDTIIEGSFENSDVIDMKVRIITLCLRREMSLFLLKQMRDKPTSCNEGWDSDLLRDIFSRLDYPETP